jgi:hypothetical protein
MNNRSIAGFRVTHVGVETDLTKLSSDEILKKIVFPFMHGLTQTQYDDMKSNHSFRAGYVKHPMYGEVFLCAHYDPEQNCTAEVQDAVNQLTFQAKLKSLWNY